MKTIILNLLLYLLVLTSCKQHKNNKEDVVNQIAKQETNITDVSTYEEVNLTTDGDYGNEIKKLELSHKTLQILLKYIDDRAYLQGVNKSERLFTWNLVNVNFYYDSTYKDVEKDIHLLVDQKDLSKGYILFPSFTEEYSTYSLYHYDNSVFDYLGEYSGETFKKGKFYFDDNSKELFSISKNEKIEFKFIDRLEFNISENKIDSDIQKISEKMDPMSSSDSINSKSQKEPDLKGNWLGLYSFKLSDLERMGESHNISYRFFISEKPYIEITIDESDDKRFYCNIIKITKDTLIIRKEKSDEDYILLKEKDQYFISGNEIYMLNPPNNKYPLTKKE
ncbi:hypothetical protein [uncultured Aquimarina sp.]|uniref:hypothetical protein n=1 Tax=uncultured Aquimarina sp. TaxID=575652 RepID=UPI00261ABEF0|nr:hypothetical protein [uncultured Aquimarina sp.]